MASIKGKKRKVDPSGDESIKVNSEIKIQVKEYVEVHGMKLGRFYDLAAKKELERLKSLESELQQKEAS